MLTSKFLKDIRAEARPIIERQLDDALQLTGLREVFTAQGGDWGALKALIKAEIQDERDEAGEGKRVRKILDKADFSTAYADMLGLANMNEDNFSSDAADDDWLKNEPIESTTPNTSVPAGFDPETGEESTTPIQPETANEQPETLGSSPSIAAREADRPATYGQLVTGGESAASNITPIRKHNGPVSSTGLARMPGCQKVDACGGMWNKRCNTCEQAFRAAEETGVA